MQPAAEDELPCLAVNTPAGEGTRCFLDVLLRVVSLAQGEQLHHLTGEVLVGLALAVGSIVEIDHHRRIAGDVMQEAREVAQRMPAQQHVLPVHDLIVFDLLLARHEVVVPEQGHLLGERRRRGQHLGQPPSAQLQALGYGVAAHCLAVFVAHRFDCWWWNDGLIHQGRRLGHRLGERAIEQPPCRLFAGQDRETLHFRFAGCKAGAVQQVACGVIADCRRLTGARRHRQQQGHQAIAKNTGPRRSHRDQLRGSPSPRP